MRILCINSGSSSIKASIYEYQNKKLYEKQIINLDINNQGILNFLLENKNSVNIICHRIVHGGQTASTCLISENVKKQISLASDFAPLHNSLALNLINKSEEIFASSIPQVAVFDTAFFSTLPELARLYALPNELCKKYSIRRYGFHGLAHQSMWEFWKTQSTNYKDKVIISLQLGSGCSITVTKNGFPLDTSMGFSPLEGLIMSTRSGDIDPGVLIFLLKQGMSTSEIEELLTKNSGLLGISNISGNIRELLSNKEKNATLAINLFCYRARKYLMSYFAVDLKPDAIIFGGGVGEHNPVIREKILCNLEWSGVKLCKNKNSIAISGNHKISADDTDLEIWSVNVNEERIMAHEALKATNNE